MDHATIGALPNNLINTVGARHAQRPKPCQVGVHVYRANSHAFVEFQFNRQRSPLALRALCLLVIFTILQCVGMGLWSSQNLLAQQALQDAVVATTLFETQFEGPPSGPATISAATLNLPPGQASLSYEGIGTLLIMVESGAVHLVIDRAIEGLAPVDESSDGSSVETIYRLRAGQRVTIPDIGIFQFRNEEDEPSSLLLLSLVSEGAPTLLLWQMQS
jgi:hypothetical protein